MQFVKYQTESGHYLVLGRMCLAMNNSKMLLILFLEDVSLRYSCIHKVIPESKRESRIFSLASSAPCCLLIGLLLTSVWQ